MPRGRPSFLATLDRTLFLAHMGRSAESRDVVVVASRIRGRAGGGMNASHASCSSWPSRRSRLGSGVTCEARGSRDVTGRCQSPNVPGLKFRFPVTPGRFQTPHFGQALERVKGIEPSSSAWKAVALPLSYTRPGVVVGEVGLEPTKAYASGFTVRPLCHSGHSPIGSATLAGIHVALVRECPTGAVSRGRSLWRERCFLSTLARRSHRQPPPLSRCRDCPCLAGCL